MLLESFAVVDDDIARLVCSVSDMPYDLSYETDRLDSDDFEAFLEKSRLEHSESDLLAAYDDEDPNDDDEEAVLAYPRLTKRDVIPSSGSSTAKAPPKNGVMPSTSHAQNSTYSGRQDPSKTRSAGSSKTNGAHTHVTLSFNLQTSSPYLDRQKALKTRLAGIESEISSYDDEIQKILELKALRTEEKKEVERELEILRRESIFGTGSSNSTGKGKQTASNCVDYHSDNFQWVPQLKVTMKRVFGIENFRLCQQGACNANVDGRDIVCIMPTGGGKSLTYQLPALLTPGCTVVISPLIALIMDQVLHLKDAGVNACMLTSATPKEETNDVYSQLRTMAEGKLPVEKEIKLLYVTPERIAKAKRFSAVLDKLYAADKLARFVVDEAHCVSQMGHSFRPDYRNLHVLRQMYPRAPIMALSATCPPRVLDDVLKTLKMKPIVDGRSAHMDQGTVYFSSPLYRPNLHYQVLPKPSSGPAALKAMVNYILAEHKDDSGIIYCLSKKDTEEVSKGLGENGIRSGVYHADVSDAEKESLHRKWRDGKVKVVCATIAFGLGIDKGDVRFVLHHSVSKTLEAYYQESGRAGRDGKEAHCIMFYRPQDAMRLSSMVCTDMDGQSKLYNMLQFAQSLTECRKVIFAKCFSHTSQLSMSSWATENMDALTPCGHCDNCARRDQPDSFDQKDVTEQAWQLLKVVDEVRRSGGRITLSSLAELVRGLGKGTVDVQGGGRGRKKKDKEQVEVNLEEVAGGKIDLSKDDTERLIIELLVAGYLAEEYHNTAYSVNVYLKAGPRAIRLTRMPKERLVSLTVDRITCSFPKHVAAKRGKKSVGGGATKGKGKEREQAQVAPILSSSSASAPRIPSKRKRKTAEEFSEEGDLDIDMADFIVDDDEEYDDGDHAPPPPLTGGSSSHPPNPYQVMSSSDEDDENGGWSFSMRKTTKTQPPRKQRRVSDRQPPKLTDEIVEILSSD